MANNSKIVSRNVLRFSVNSQIIPVSFTAVNLLDQRNERLYNSHITDALKSLSTIISVIPTIINYTKRILSDVFRSGAKIKRQKTSRTTRVP